MRFRFSIEIAFSSAVAAVASMESDEVIRVDPTNERGYNESSIDPFFPQKIAVPQRSNANAKRNEALKQALLPKNASEKQQRRSKSRTLRNTVVSRRTTDDKPSHNDDSASVLDATNELGILSGSEHRSSTTNLIRLRQAGDVDVDVDGDVDGGVVDACDGGNRPLIGADVNFHKLINTCLYSSGCPYDADTMGCWNTSLVTDMSYAFFGAGAFNQTIGGWETSAVTDMKAMFQHADSFNTAIDDWNTSSVTDMSYMFSLADSFNQPLGSWQTSNVTDMSYMFAKAGIFNQPIGSWQTSAVTDMKSMLRGAKYFDQPVETWQTSSVTDMSKMFNGAGSFNQPLGSWETEACENTHYMFNFATSFNQPIDSWQTSNVRTMGYMFAGAKSFNQPLGSWQTHSVTDMRSMFRSAKSFDQPVEFWQTSGVTDMNKMFHGAGSFNKPLESWDVSSVKSMESMFSKATFFNQCLSSWGEGNNTVGNLQRDFMFDESGCPFVHTSCHWTFQPYPEYCGYNLEQIAVPWCQGSKLQCGRLVVFRDPTLYDNFVDGFPTMPSSGVPPSAGWYNKNFNRRSTKLSELSNGSAFAAAVVLGILLPNFFFFS